MTRTIYKAKIPMWAIVVALLAIALIGMQYFNIQLPVMQSALFYGDSYSGLINKNYPITVGGYGFLYQGWGTATGTINVRITACNGAIIADNLVCTLNTPITKTVGNHIISVKPYTGGINAAGVNINVEPTCPGLAQIGTDNNGCPIWKCPAPACTGSECTCSLSCPLDKPNQKPAPDCSCYANDTQPPVDTQIPTDLVPIGIIAASILVGIWLFLGREK